MAGLLGLEDDPASQGLLSLGLRLMATPGKFSSALGTSGLGAMGDLNAAAQAKQRRDLLAQEQRSREQQMLMLQQQMQQQMQEQARQAAIRQAYTDAMRSPEQQAVAQFGGPTMAAANAAPGMAPQFDQQALIRGLAAAGAGSEAYAMAQPKPEDMKVVGDSLVGIQGGKARELYRAPAKPESRPEALRALAAVYGEGSPEYMQAARQYAQKLTTHQPGVSVTYGSPVPFQLPDGSTGYVQPGNKPGAAPQVMSGTDGKPILRPTEDKALTEGQAKALAFASRMLSADKTLAELSRAGVNVSTPGAGAGYGVGTAINIVQGEKQQMLDQAKRDFINATLRRESGAVIGKDEFINADNQYFPQIGDSRPVIELKARNRRTAIEGVRADVPKSKQSEVDRIANPAGNGWSITPVP